MFSATDLEAKIRAEELAEVELAVTARVLNQLEHEKEAAKNRLEDAKNDLNEIDAAIAARTPRVEEETTEEVQG